MEHEDRNETIRLKMLDEIADIEAFISNRSLEALFEERMWQKAVVMSLVNLGELCKLVFVDIKASVFRSRFHKRSY